MDELLIMVLCAALAGIIIGSLGTIVTFWCCGKFERRAVGGRIDPGLENALIQAGYGEGISGETAGSIQLRRTQTFSVNDPVASSFRLHVGNAGTRYQITLIAFVDAIPTRSSGNYLFVKFAAPRQRLLRLGNVFLSLNKDRSFI